MVIETASSPGPFRNTQMSKAAQTHKLRKLRAPSKCRECDGLVVFHGAECEEVTLVSFLLICFRAYGFKLDPTMVLYWELLILCSESKAFRTLKAEAECCQFHNGVFISHGEQISNKNKSWNWSQAFLWDQIHWWSQSGMGSGNCRPFVRLLRSPLPHPCTSFHIY